MSGSKSLLLPIKSFVRANSNVILLGIGVSGTVSTAVLAAKASKEATLHLSDQGLLDASIKDKTIEVWKYYIPPAVVGGVTVAAIISANTINSRRAAGLAAAYSVSEKTLSEYREKVIEKIGESQERSVKDAVAKSKVDENPPKAPIELGELNVLTMELFTGRYFASDMESLRKAQNDINEQLLREGPVTLSEFYWRVGLPSTSHSDYVGWVPEELLELDFSTVMSGSGVPCIAFSYNYVKPF